MTDLIKRLADRRYRAAWLVLVVCLVLTWLVWSGLREQTMKLAEKEFGLHVADVEDSIKDRMRQHEQILLGGAGLFEASSAVTRSEWRVYVERLKLAKNYPGEGAVLPQLEKFAIIQGSPDDDSGQLGGGRVMLVAFGPETIPP